MTPTDTAPIDDLESTKEDESMINLEHIELKFDCYKCGVEKVVTCYNLARFGRPSCPECGEEVSAACGRQGRVADPDSLDGPLYRDMREIGQEWINIKRHELEWEGMDENLERAYGILICVFVLNDRAMTNTDNPFDPDISSILKGMIEDQMEQLPSRYCRHIDAIEGHLKALRDEE